MKIVLRVVFGIIALPILLLLYGIISAPMDNPVRLNSDKFRPIGLRIEGSFFGEGIKVRGYGSAWMQTYNLEKDLQPILGEMGLDYLNALKPFQGGDDGYSPWMVGPLDPEKVASSYPLNASILAGMKKVCPMTWNGPDRWCVWYQAILTKPKVYYAYGAGQIAILDPAQSYLQVMYLGPSL
ncbi:hypothetical protein [Rhizobium laguerreae]|uniref:hypothetical protein n=1 Tax=Rhizobium laguerreae TaxID=1076926 RepID=UPI001C922A0E|nr:hypothetical protein [Rhizobium laguerreae]MBY3136525.1 hypothetical protein [Rhizobium laguerreae]MBY3517070.1 hypothetical protein [Rhizobium laguerreae]